MKRLFDIVASLIALILLSPIMIVIGIVVSLESSGGPFFRQKRIGRYGKSFVLLKFRSMRVGSDEKGLITVGAKDLRITKSGQFIRKYKIDELPQLFNILLGDMSIVGPRPEVEKYVNMYSEKQKKVLSVRPGLTDYASLEYFDESEELAKSPNPDLTYTEVIMPRKLSLNLKYIEDQSLLTDLKIIGQTVKRIFS